MTVSTTTVGSALDGTNYVTDFKIQKQQGFLNVAVLQGVHGKVGSDAVGKQDDGIILAAQDAVVGYNLLLHKPGERALIIDAVQVEIGTVFSVLLDLTGVSALAVQI